MLIYQKNGEEDKLNILINGDLSAENADSYNGDVVLQKSRATGIVTAAFGTIASAFEISGNRYSVTDNNLIISGQAILTGSDTATVDATLTLPIIDDSPSNTLVCRDNDRQINLPEQVGEYASQPGEFQAVNRGWVANKISEGITDIANGTVSGTIKAIKNGSTINALVYGWNTKLDTLTAGDYIAITGEGNSRTIAVTNATSSAVGNKIVCRADYGQINLPVQAGSEQVQEPGPHQSVSKVWVASKIQEEVTNVYDGTVPGTIKVTKNGNDRNVQVYGWDNKIGSLTAGSFITITGSGDGRTIAVTGLGTAAYKNTDYFLAANATAVNASSLGGQSPAYYTNVQSDWSQTDSNADDYIKNKPTIPTDTNQKVKVDDVTFGDNDVINIVAGNNITVAGSTTGDGAPKITISSTYTDTGATGVTITGSGNVFSNASYDASTRKITFTKGITALTSHQSIKKLNTTATTAQSINSSEDIAGNGTITLHKVSKTGSYDDLTNKPTIPDDSVFRRLPYTTNGACYLVDACNHSVNYKIGIQWTPFNNPTYASNIFGISFTRYNDGIICGFELHEGTVGTEDVEYAIQNGQFNCCANNEDNNFFVSLFSTIKRKTIGNETKYILALYYIKDNGSFAPYTEWYRYADDEEQSLTFRPANKF